MKLKLLTAALIFMCTANVDFAAQAPEQSAGEVTVKSGTSTVIRRWWRCKDVLPAISSATAEHGTAVLRTGEGNHCGNPKQPELQLVYTPAPGFKGQDTGFFYFTRWAYRITITVE